MDEARKNRDFSKGPVWDPKTDRWLVEIRYPDGRRCRKRFRREREALRLWSTEQAKIENGIWHEQAPKIIALGVALEQYPDTQHGPQAHQSISVGVGVGGLVEQGRARPEDEEQPRLRGAAQRHRTRS
jgi:hypothetical protein